MVPNVCEGFTQNKLALERGILVGGYVVVMLNHSMTATACSRALKYPFKAALTTEAGVP